MNEINLPINWYCCGFKTYIKLSEIESVQIVNGEDQAVFSVEKPLSALWIFLKSGDTKIIKYNTYSEALNSANLLFDAWRKSDHLKA